MNALFTLKRLTEVLPRSYFEALCSPLLPWNVLPRRIRFTGLHNEDPRLIQSIVETQARRTQRLLNSFSELEREIRDSTSMLYESTQWKANDEDDEWDNEKLRYTVERARGVQVPENDLTDEFRAVRDPYFYDEGKEDLWRWRTYRYHCRRRHAWGHYFRSTMDWDPDVIYAMKHMFKLPANWLKSTSSPAARLFLPTNPAPEVDISSGESWKILAGPTPRTLPKEVRIAYTTQTGTTKFKTFFAEPSAEDFIPLRVREKKTGKASLEDYREAFVIEDHDEAGYVA